MASEEQIARFLAGADKPQRAPKEPKQQQRRTPLGRGRRPRQEVPLERRGFWHGVMCMQLRLQEQEPYFAGFYRCECGDPACDAQVEGFDEARRFFVPGHLKPRASFNHKGFRFPYVATLGPDDPNNIVPVTPECNRAEFWNRNQEQPQWTKGEAS